MLRSKSRRSLKVESADAQQKEKPASDDERVKEKEKKGEDGSQSISLQDTYDALLHDNQMKRVILNILCSMLFFALVIAMLFSHFPATNSMYLLGYSVSSTLASSGADTITTDSTMKFFNIQTTSDTFEWLTDTFVPSVFVTEDYNGNLLEKDKWGRVASFNRILGAVIFETERAQIHPCRADQYLLDLYPTCYNPDSVTSNTTLISFDTNTTEATDIISRLKANGTWVDFSTQSLAITVVTYNGEIQCYAVTKLTLEFHQGGYVEPSSSTMPALSDPYKETYPVVLDILVGVCWFVAAVSFVVTYFDRIREDRSRQLGVAAAKQSSASTLFRHLLHDSNLLADMFFSVKTLSGLLVVLFYVCWLLIVRIMTAKTFRDNLARLVVTGKKFDVNSDERKGLMAVTNSLEDIASLTILMRAFAALTVFLLGTRILKSFHSHPRLGVLTRTIASALHQFGWVFVVFVVIFITFSVSGTVLFGDRVEGFSSLGKSLETCINMLFGSFDYATIQNVYSPVSMLYYWAYMIIVSLVLLNMMLAIVVDAYADVSSEKNQVTKNTSTGRALMNIAWDLSEMLSNVPNCTRRSGGGGEGRRSKRGILASGTSSVNRETDRGAIVDFRDLSAEEVVSNGKIKPTLLLKLLASAIEIRNDGTDNRVTAARSDVSTALLTPTLLQDWFAGAKLSDAVARETIRYTLEGMEETNQMGREGAVDDELQPYQSKEEVSSEQIKKSSEAELSIASKDDMELRQPSAPHVPIDEVTKSTTSAPKDGNADPQIVQLLKQMEAVQQKMDLLLSNASVK